MTNAFTAAATAAKERLKSRRSPQRQPVCGEDHAALASQSCTDSANPCWASAPNVPTQVAQTGTAAKTPYEKYMATAYKGLAGLDGAHDEEGEGEEEGPKVAPTVTCRLVCCYLLLLLIGLVAGMVANELKWVDLSEVDPTLERLEDWLHRPHNDPMHGGEFCADGLFLEGPSRTGANTLLYLGLLLWAFLGVAIAADVFMAGIEQITSEETTQSVVLPSGEVRRYTITVWNATVANLTLMALGSSAPEILLSVIEIVSSGFYAGELGPSTIVGSAAFNMLVISGVCIVAIPNGGGRTIKELPVFYVTAAASLLAYVWLLVILVYVTPNVVDVWEGMATFLMFPALVYVAYKIDVSNDAPPTFADDDPEGAAAAAPIGWDKNGREINKNDVSRVLALKSIEKLSGDEQIAAVASMLLPPQSRAYYRKAGLNAALGTEGTSDGSALRARILEEEGKAVERKGTTRVEWAQGKRTCREAQGEVELAIVRLGDPSTTCSVQYATTSGSATEGVDFERAAGKVTFLPGVTMHSITVKIINDEEEEDDEHFSVSLFAPKGCKLGVTTLCDVTIQDDDGPGELHFDSREIEVYESAHHATLTVLRTHGCEGTISCQWETRDGTSTDGRGYIGASGRLEFEDGVLSKTLQIELVDTGAYHRADEFQVVLFSAAGRVGQKPARFVTDGVTRTRRAAIFAAVHVHSDAARQAKVDEMVQLLDFQSQSVEPQSNGYEEQFVEAVALPSDGSSISLIMWILALPWKLVGACVPPPSLQGGWACFGVALVAIGALTALIGDLAAHMGCCMGLSKSVTAITFVALGTSLPDTFASRQAAVAEPHADASIVNITGSNSVNVFLGLGMPWAVAALYWATLGASSEEEWRRRYQHEPWYTRDMPVGFAVPAGDLAYSVQVFVAVSLVCLATLIARRQLLGAELGGPSCTKWMSFALMLALWGVYLTLSIVHSTASS